MEAITFWNTYVQDLPPAEFVWRYGKGNYHTAVEEYLHQRPALFGIVRRGTWKETFSAEHQYNRQYVRTGLMEYLEETEPVWRPLVDAAREDEIKARAEAKARSEAEALALAVARVEAEARARAEEERLRTLQQEHGEAQEPLPGGESTPPEVSAPPIAEAASEASPSAEQLPDPPADSPVQDAAPECSLPVEPSVEEAPDAPPASPEERQAETHEGGARFDAPEAS